MRIRRIRISSIGGIRDRDYETDDRMTVFYGPNESGKTSTMEFIRRVLVPSNARNMYPVKDNPAVGTLTVEESGQIRDLAISAKKVTGDVPGCLDKVKPDMYRNIFAMDLDSLNESKSVEDGEIKSKFLTIPGGEGMSAALSGAESDIRSIVGLKSNSSSDLNGIEARIDAAEKRLADLRERSDSYAKLDSDIGERVAELDGMTQAIDEERRIQVSNSVISSNMQNYRMLEEEKGKLEALGTFRTVTDSDISDKASLEADLVSKNTVADSVEGRKADIVARLQGFDRRKVSAKSEDIDYLSMNKTQYINDLRELSEIRSGPAPAPAVRRQSISPMLIAGLVMIVLGAVAALVVSPYVAVLSVAGMVVAAASFRSKPAASVVHTADPGRESHLAASIGRYETVLNELREYIGIQDSDVDRVVSKLLKAKAAAEDYSKLEKDMMRASQDVLKAKTDKDSFLQAFGGEEGFDVCLRKTREAARCNHRMEQLRSSIEGAGLDPDHPPEVREQTQSDLGTKAQELSKEIGRLEQEKLSILGDNEIEQTLDEISQLRSERLDILRRGAEAILVKSIADNACASAYGGVQPAVASTADRYLSMMTAGRYDLEIDPRTDSIVLRDNGGDKTIPMWSSGLRAQALLSVKLAIAKEMGSGEVPVMLDDVLLPFDSERKEGAVRALSEISREMQVIMFTCDSETRDLAAGMGIPVIDM